MTNLTDREIDELLQSSFEYHKSVFTLFNSENFHKDIKRAALKIIEVFNEGGKVLVCGNGGSSSDSCHFVTELTVRFKRERNPFPAIALGTNTASITACSNDYSYEYIFEREFQALANKKDFLIAITTSGQSENINRVISAANEQSINWLLLTSDKCKLSSDINQIIKIPSDQTSTIQEMHIFVLHCLCEIIDHIDL